jgi:hypothetical protein
MGGLEDFGGFYEGHVGAVTAYLARRVGRADLTFEIARIEQRRGCSEQVVRRRVSRGLAALRRNIGESA